MSPPLRTNDPSLSLKLNGNGVSRMKDGSFEIEVTLKRGENNFTFSQNVKTYALMIIGK